MLYGKGKFRHNFFARYRNIFLRYQQGESEGKISMEIEGLKEATDEAVIMRLVAENTELRNYIIAAYNAQDDHEQRNIIVNAMDYLEGMRIEKDREEDWSKANIWVKEQEEHDD